MPTGAKTPDQRTDRYPGTAKALPDGFQTEFVETAERAQTGRGEDSVGHAEIFPMGTRGGWRMSRSGTAPRRCWCGYAAIGATRASWSRGRRSCVLRPPRYQHGPAEAINGRLEHLRGSALDSDPPTPSNAMSR
jgi:hypothetical protein